MKLDAVQRRIVLNKQLGYSLLKGKVSSGKTTAAIHRAIYLKNQYCLFEDDTVLIVSDKDINVDIARKIYDKVEENNKLEYITLFTNPEDKLSFCSIENIICKYFNNSEKSKYTIIKEEDKIITINKCIKIIKERYKKLKILDLKYSKFLVDEIKWIKCCNYNTIDAYQSADRTGRKVKKGEGPQRLLKNSKSREAIFNLMLSYNKILEENHLVDSEERDLIALDYIKNFNNKFTHIIVDEFQNFTKVQFEIVKALLNNKDYASMLLVNSQDNNSNPNGWFVKGRKLNSIGIYTKIKTYSLKNTYKDSLELKEKMNNLERMNAEEKNNYYESVLSIETFEYHDIRHNRKYDFVRDINDISDVIVKNEDREDEYTKDELKELAVYNDIAAGEPILINPDIEDKFYIPKFWLKGVNDCFILKVKGDSMINANIDDNDYVVIRKQYAAQNNDIVAVDIDGSATLKRLSMGKSGIKLMPENSKYNPIPITDEGTNIIGIAVGIIKYKH